MSASASPTAPPLVTIESNTSWLALDLKELWQNRDLLLNFIAKDIKVGYKQTAVGVVWVVLQPLIAALLFAFVFGRVAGIEAPGGVPYIVFVFVGVAVYNMFNKVLSKASSTLVVNANLVAKIYFPRLLLPIAAAVANLTDFLVAIGVMAVLMVLSYHYLSWMILLAPVLVGFIVLLAMGISFATSALSVQFRDVNFVLPVFLQLMMWATPVVYAVEKVPTEPIFEHLPLWMQESWIGPWLGQITILDIYLLNPLASLFEAIRVCVLGVGQVNTGYLIYSMVFCVVVFLAGLLVFKRLERRFSDVI